MTLCEFCRYWADKLAKLQPYPAVWQLMIGSRAKYLGHWKVHDELRERYASTFGATA